MMKKKEFSMAEFFSYYKSYWDEVYEKDIKNPEPVVSLLEFRRKPIPNTPYWKVYCKSFCDRKPKLSNDYFKAPKEHTIGYNGPHLFLMNAAPMGRYHSLLLPYFSDNLFQEIDKANQLSPAFDLMKESDTDDFRVLFNEAKAGGSMNQLHYHLLSVKEFIGQDRFPIENVAEGCRISCSNPVISIFKKSTALYDLPHFVIKCSIKLDDELSYEMAKISTKLIKAVREIGKQYIFLISDKGQTIYIVPKNKGPKTIISSGSDGCSGVFISLDEKFFNNLNQKKIQDHLRILRVRNDDLEKIETIFRK